MRKKHENRNARSGGVKRSSYSAVKPLPKINRRPKSAHGAKKRTANLHTNDNGSSVILELSEFGLNISSIRNGPALEAAMT